MQKQILNLSTILILVILIFSINLSNSLAGEEKKESIKETVEIPVAIVKKAMPAYSINLKRLMEEAKRNIKKVEGEIEDQEILGRNRQREEKIRQHYKKAETLYNEGKLKKAKREWQEVLKLAHDPEMKGYISKVTKTALEY